MGALTVDSWRRLDDLVKAHGDDDVLHMICEQVVLTGDLSVVGEREGILGRVIWKWLNDSAHPERMAEYKDTLAYKGEREAHRMLRIADEAVPEDVAVAKLRIDTRDKLIKSWNKPMYGKEEGGGAGGITVLIDRGLEAKVEGGVLKISAEQKQGDQFIEGEVVGGNQATI